jgi:thermostable 8-oxoguanine DNA glycosylase
MITAAQISPFYKKVSENYAAAESLKERLAQLLKERQPFYLTSVEFEEILRWKLRGQFGRQQAQRTVNTEEVVRLVTGLALAITHVDEEYELELRMAILCALRGVGVPVASAILTLVYPDKYAVIDFRVWRQVFDEDKKTFLIGDYKRYMQVIRQLANELGWSVQQVDVAIWEYDRSMNKR